MRSACTNQSLYQTSVKIREFIGLFNLYIRQLVFSMTSNARIRVIPCFPLISSHALLCFPLVSVTLSSLCPFISTSVPQRYLNTHHLTKQFPLASLGEIGPFADGQANHTAEEGRECRVCGRQPCHLCGMQGIQHVELSADNTHCRGFISTNLWLCALPQQWLISFQNAFEYIGIACQIMQR